jgi:hypothetical protein
MSNDSGDPSVIQPDDLRLEYAELGNNLRAGMVVLWEAFKTYFTIAALLFAGCGFLLSSQSPFAVRTSMGACLFVAVAGLAITVLGARGMRRILAYQRAFIARGRRIEATMHTKLFAVSNRTWRRSGILGSDNLTYAVFALFALGWLIIAVICVACLVFKSCPTPVCG